jgi:tetratricopeptide (TPR) repeat protein
MRIIGIILWVLDVLWAIAQGLNIRQKAKNEQATEHTFELHAFLLAISVIVIPSLSLSPFHLLWMLPTSFVLGLASVIFPLNLLWFPASLYGSLWYIGTGNPGRAFYLAGDYAKAIECYKEIVQRKPDSAEAHFNLGVAYGKIGENKKAIECFRETIRLDPTSHVAYCNLGLDYKDLGDNDNAVESFKEAIRIKPDYVKARWNLGMTYVEVGDIANALKEHEILHKLDKQHADELYSAIYAKNE